MPEVAPVTYSSYMRDGNLQKADGKWRQLGGMHQHELVSDAEPCNIYNIYICLPWHKALNAVVAELSICKWKNQRRCIASLLLWVSHLSACQTELSSVLSDEHLELNLTSMNWVREKTKRLRFTLTSLFHDWITLQGILKEWFNHKTGLSG